MLQIVLLIHINVWGKDKWDSWIASHYPSVFSEFLLTKVIPLREKVIEGGDAMEEWSPLLNLFLHLPCYLLDVQAAAISSGCRIFGEQFSSMYLAFPYCPFHLSPGMNLGSDCLGALQVGDMMSCWKPYFPKEFEWYFFGLFFFWGMRIKIQYLDNLSLRIYLS